MSREKAIRKIKDIDKLKAAMSGCDKCRKQYEDEVTKKQEVIEQLRAELKAKKVLRQ